MGIFQYMFSKPVPSHAKAEVERHIQDLVQIGKHDDFLAERPSAGFNFQLRHVRAREIGARLNELGGFELMEYVHWEVKRKLGKDLATHLSYCWAEIGKWAA